MKLRPSHNCHFVGTPYLDRFHHKFPLNGVEMHLPTTNDSQRTGRGKNILENTSATVWIQHAPEEAKSRRMSAHLCK